MWTSGQRGRIKLLLNASDPSKGNPRSCSPHSKFLSRLHPPDSTWLPRLRRRRRLLTTVHTSTVTMANNNQDKDDLEPIFKQKRLLRSKVRQGLKSMDLSLRSHEDDAIQRIVLESPWFKSSQRLCAYISCSALREVDTSRLVSEILQNPAKENDTHVAKKLYVPRVEDKNSHMRMFNISRMDDLIANSMNILEPSPVDSDGNDREDVMHANDPVDLFILPGLAFDKSGRRLGRGGGYYDTFLRKYQELATERNWRQPLLVALSYSVQVMDEGVISVTPNDVLVDALVSPSGAIPISPAALDSMLRL